jgi:hypothetical protein
VATAASPKVVQSAALLDGCSKSGPRWEGCCAWCSEDLPPRRRTWCSERCSTAFWTNHWWSPARRAAKRRDKYSCVQCGHRPPKRPTRAAFGTQGDYRAAMTAYRAVRKTDRLEVNHIVPALGRHGVLSCIHHLENLETLCVACHKRYTRLVAVTRD